MLEVRERPLPDPNLFPHPRQTLLTFYQTDIPAAIGKSTSGIALGTSKIFFARGVSLPLADLQKERLDANLATIVGESSGVESRILTITVDVRSSDSINQRIQETAEKFGRLDGAANIAGVVGPHAGIHGIADLGNEDWGFVIGVYLNGVFYRMRAELHVMSGPGSIVNAASIVGLEGYANGADYGVSKHGVIGLMRCDAKEVGKKNIRDNVIAPGVINTLLGSRCCKDGDRHCRQQPADKYGFGAA